MSPRFLFQTVAIALGVLAGIYAASCGEDNKPEAAASHEFVVVVREFVARDRTYPLAQFRLGLADGNEAVISLNPTLPLAQFLRAHNGQRVALSFEVQ